MRIGLLTYHWAANYGANLQMYSTYSFLKKSGCNPILINWIPESGKNYYKVVSGLAQLECHHKFFIDRCDTTREFSDVSEYPVILKEYGITHVIVGSDSVLNIIKDRYDWLHLKKIVNTVDHTFPNPFWCDSIDIPHSLLSVSSQNANYRDFAGQRKEIGDALKRFVTITVRDTWTQSMVSFFTDGSITPKITPDPVFGFNENVNDTLTRELIRKKFDLPERYVLFTFNNGRMKAPLKWVYTIKKLFNDKGYSCVYLPRSTDSQELHLDAKIDMPIDPLDWYDIIRYSNGYIGVLMHPIVVCLHNSVPCFSFDHYGNGPILLANKKSSKIYDIMEKADVLSCHYFLRNHLKFPSPYYVYNCIMDFPESKIKLFSSKMQKECTENMSKIVSELKYNKE